MAFCCNLFALIVLCLGALLHIVSIAVPYYGSFKVTGLGEYEMGVWKYCLEFENQEWCGHFGQTVAGIKLLEAPDWLKASEAFSIIGLIVVAAAGVLAILAMLQRICSDHVKVLPYIACVVAAIGGVVLSVGVTIFAAKFHEGFETVNGIPSTDLSLDWAFYVDIAACVVIFVGSFMLCVTGRQAGLGGAAEIA